MYKKASNLKFFGVNMLIALGIVVIIVIVMVAWMKKYTNHGCEIEVPQITGLYPNEATNLLASMNLQLEVVDSTFSKKVPLGTIVEQNPPEESKVKEGRAIYVVINATTHRQVILPELHDISYRQAENILRQLGLQVGEILFEPSEYRDLVLDIRAGDLSLETGTKLNEGTILTMVVGQGRGTEMVSVPDVAGLKLTEVRSLLLTYHLTIGCVEYDMEPTAENRESYVVYSQHPQSGVSVLEGSSVQIKLSMDKSKAVTENNITEEDEFF